MKKNKNKYSFLLVIVLTTTFISGCSRVTRPNIEPNKYINLCACSAAMASVRPNDDVNPSGPDVIPDTPTVRRPKDCDTCSHNGWLGDGRPRSDCPDCDYNGDGNNEDPMSVFNQIIQESEKPIEKPIEKPGDKPEEGLDNKLEEQAEFTNEELGLDYIKWTTNSQQAISKAKSIDKPILVVLEEGTPSDIWDDDDIIKLVNDRFVTLFGDLSDQMIGSAWAKEARNTKLVKFQNSTFQFKQPIIAILTPEGTFGKNDPTKVFFEIPSNKTKLLKLLQELK